MSKARVSEPMKVRHCHGEDAHAFVAQGDGENFPDISDQLIALGLFLQENPNLTVSALNVVNNWERSNSYSYVFASINGDVKGIPTESKYGSVCEKCGN